MAAWTEGSHSEHFHMLGIIVHVEGVLMCHGFWQETSHILGEYESKSQVNMSGSIRIRPRRHIQGDSVQEQGDLPQDFK